MRIAVFDLDGTITRGDTLWPYLRGWARRHPRRGFWPRTVAALGRYPLERDRGRLKSRLIRIAMGGSTRADVQAWTADYVASLGNSELCPGALAAIERHRAGADRLVLLSASVDLYVPAIAHRLGFDEAVCTEVAWRDGRLDGALVTENRRGGEKRRCIESIRARFPGAKLTAYGNARSDFAHLQAVEEPVLVNAGRGLRRAGERLGFGTAEWRNNLRVEPVQSA
jgi:phosphatidylglycerophosphatase C